MSDKPKRKTNYRRWIFIVLILLIGGAVLLSQSRNDTPTREKIVMNTTPFSGIQKTNEEST